ncbi:MAG: ABC transporter permease, partial [Pirellulales bacterium]
MSVLDRKLVRELKSTRGLLVAITSIMAVGVACYVALGFAYKNLSTAQRQYYARCRMADFSIEVNKAPLAELAALEKISGVVEIRPRIQFFATVDLERVSGPINGLVLSLPDRRQEVINDIVLQRGGYFSDSRANEVIVNDAFARRHGLHPGHWIHLLLNNQRQELFIVGTAISSEFTYLLGPGNITPDSEHFGVFYLKQTYADEVFDFEGAANQVLGRLAPGVRPHEVLRRAELLLAPYGVLNTTPLEEQPSHRFLGNEIQGLEAFGVINPAIFLSVAALVLNVLMTRLTEQQRVVVGTLKALGYLDRQVLGHFLKFGLCIGLLSGVLGALLGYWLAEAMTALYRQFFQFPTLVNRFYPGTFVEGLLISLVCALAGSANGARAVLRLEPAEAMRQKPPAQGGPIFLERFTPLWSRLSFGWRMTLRNVVRHRFRTAAGIFAAAMGAALVVNSLMLVEATAYMIEFQFEKIQRSDVDLSFKDEMGSDALGELVHLPGVDH